MLGKHIRFYHDVFLKHGASAEPHDTVHTVPLRAGRQAVNLLFPPFKKSPPHSGENVQLLTAEKRCAGCNRIRFFPINWGVGGAPAP